MSESKKDLYIVPYDFTDTAQDALNYAVSLSSKNNADITLLHISKTKGDSAQAQKKLKSRVQELGEDGHGHIDYKVIVGDIFEDLDKAAQMMDATLIIMGTHGRSGFRNIFGSYAQKMIDHSQSPFVLIQDDVNKDDIHSIVMPFNFDRESMQITDLAASIAHKFNSTIHLVGRHESDEWHETNFKVNGKIISQFLSEHGIKHDLHFIKSDEPYEAQLIEYANEVNADLIAASFYVRGFLSYYHSFLDELIMNKYKIPVLTVNAPEMMTLGSRFSFITT